MPRKSNYNNDESFNRLCDCLRMIREDLRNGKFTKIGDYTHTFGVAAFNQRLVLGIVDDHNEAALVERASYIRMVQNRVAFYCNMKARGKVAVNIESVDDAIELLKSKGYKVMKPKIEYEEV